MRKIALIIITAGIFVSLAYWLINDYQDQSTSAWNVSKHDRTTAPLLLPKGYQNTLRHDAAPLRLKLDSTLKRKEAAQSSSSKLSPSASSSEMTGVKQGIQRLELSRHSKPLSILSVALLLGMLSGSLIARSVLPQASNDNQSQTAASEESSIAPLEYTAEDRDVPKPLELSADQVYLHDEIGIERRTHLPSELEQEILALQKHIDSNQLELSETETRLMDREATIEELRAEVRDSDALSAQLQQSQQKQLELSQELEERDDSIKDLHDDVDRWRQQWATHEEQAHEITAQTMLLRSENESLEKQVHTLADSNEVLIATQANLEEQISQLALQAERALNLETQVNQLDESIATFVKDSEQLSKRLEISQARAQQADELEHTLNLKNKDLDGILAEKNSTENSLIQLQQRYDQIEQEYQHAMQTAEQQASSHQQQSEQIEELSSHLNELEVQLSDRSETLTQRQEQIIELRAKYLQLEEQNSALQAELNAAQTEQQRRAAENEELAGHISTLQVEAQETKQLTADREELVAQLQEQLDTQHREFEERQTELDNLTQQLSASELSRQSLEKSLIAASEVETRLDAWKNSLDTYRQEVIEKNRLIDRLHDEISLGNERSELLKQQIREMDTQLEEYQDVRVELQTLDATHTAFRTTLDGQNTQFDGLQAETLQHEVSITNALHQINSVKLQAQTWQEELTQSAHQIKGLQQTTSDKEALLRQLDEEMELAITVSDLTLPPNLVDKNPTPEIMLQKSRVLTTAMEITQLALSRSDERLQSTALECEKQSQVIEGQNKQLTEQLSTIEQQLIALETHQLAAQKNTVLAQESLQSAEARSTEIEAQKEKISHQASNLDKLKQHLRSAEVELETQKTKVEGLLTELDQSNSSSESLTLSFEGQRKQLEEQRAMLLGRDEQILQLQVQLGETSEQFEQHIKEQKTTLEQRDDQISQLQVQIDEESEQFTQRINVHEQDNISLVEKHAKLSAEIEESQHILSKQQTAYDQLTRERNDQNTSHQQLLEERNELQLAVDALSRDYEENKHNNLELNNRMKADQQAVSQLRSDLTDKKAEIAEMENSLTQQNQKIEELEAQLTSANATQTKLQQDYQDAQSRQLEQNELRLQEETSALRNKEKERSNQLRGALQQQKTHNKKLTQYVQQLREKIDELQPAEMSVPVLTNKVVVGEKESDIPVLGRPLGKNSNTSDES